MRLLLLVALFLAGCAGQEQAAPVLANLTLPRETVSALGTPSDVPVSVTGATPPKSTSAPGSGGGGSGGGGSAPAPQNAVFVVHDAADLPVANATVTLADGRTAISDSSGQAVLGGAFTNGLVTVSAAGYATSIVAGLDGGATLHLRAPGPVAGAFLQQTTTLHGSVTWPSSDHVGGEVYYQDDLDSRAAPAAIATDGSYAIAVTSTQPGTPHGVVLAIAGNSANQTLMGISEAISASTTVLPAIAMAVADQPVQTSVTGVPAGLDHLSSQLEILEPGAPPMVITGYPNSSGAYQVPAPGALPGSLRVTVKAQDDADTLESSVSMAVSGGVASGTFLPLPSVSFQANTRQLTWTTVPGATGYYASAGPVTDAVPAWEAWTGSLMPFTLPSADWLSPGQGQITLEAIDDAGLGARQVASLARQLRVEPWTEQSAYRVSRRRLLL